MLTSKDEKRICNDYSKRDEKGFVHCKDCPLVVDADGFLCRANAHYDEDQKDWMPDD